MASPDRPIKSWKDGDLDVALWRSKLPYSEYHITINQQYLDRDNQFERTPFINADKIGILIPMLKEAYSELKKIQSSTDT